MSLNEFDVNIAYKIIDIANNEVPVWWMEVQCIPFSF